MLDWERRAVSPPEALADVASGMRLFVHGPRGELRRAFAEICHILLGPECAPAP